MILTVTTAQLDVQSKTVCHKLVIFELFYSWFQELLLSLLLSGMPYSKATSMIGFIISQASVMTSLACNLDASRSGSESVTAEAVCPDSSTSEKEDKKGPRWAQSCPVALR